MNELWIALVSAGAAVSGAAVGGWLARSAGIRQAEAAKHAGDRQAEALLSTVQATLDEQRTARIEDRRRQAYVDFLRIADEVYRTEVTRERSRKFDEALTIVIIEGPQSVIDAAISFADLARGHSGDGSRVDAVSSARNEYIIAVRNTVGAYRLDPDAPNSSTRN